MTIDGVDSSVLACTELISVAIVFLFFYSFIPTVNVVKTFKVSAEPGSLYEAL